MLKQTLSYRFLHGWETISKNKKQTELFDCLHIEQLHTIQLKTLRFRNGYALNKAKDLSRKKFCKENISKVLYTSKGITERQVM